MFVVDIKFVKHLPAKMWWLGLILIVALGVIFYFVLVQGAKSSIVNQQLRREQTLARAEASNITSFFRVFGDGISVLAQLKSMENPSAVTQANLDAFVEQWKDSGLIGGVVLTDKKGTVVMNSNVLGTHDTGASLADRDYFLWAETQTGEGNYFVGKAVVSRLGASKDQVIVVVASPVFRGEVFTGVVAASVEIRPLAEHYLALMKITDKTYVYLVGKDGDLLFNSFKKDNVGSKVFDLSQGQLLDNQFLSDRVKSAIAKGEEGKFTLPYKDPVSGKLEPHLIGYAPVFLGNRNWLVVISDPIQNVNDLATPFYIRDTAVLLLVSLTILLYGIIVARETQKRL